MTNFNQGSVFKLFAKQLLFRTFSIVSSKGLANHQEGHRIVFCNTCKRIYFKHYFNNHRCGIVNSNGSTSTSTEADNSHPEQPPLPPAPSPDEPCAHCADDPPLGTLGAGQNNGPQQILSWMSKIRMICVWFTTLQCLQPLLPMRGAQDTASASRADDDEAEDPPVGLLDPGTQPQESMKLMPIFRVIWLWMCSLFLFTTCVTQVDEWPDPAIDVGTWWQYWCILFIMCRGATCISGDGAHSNQGYIFMTLYLDCILKIFLISILNKRLIGLKFFNSDLHGVSAKCMLKHAKCMLIAC